MRIPAVLVAILLASPLASASGRLDPRFDGDGVRTVDHSQPANIGDLFFAGLIDRSGRHVGTGYARSFGTTVATIVRLRPDGALDASFGSGGVARLPLLDGYGAAYMVAIAEQDDGRLVVAGRAGINTSAGDPSRAYVCRVLDDGSMDTGFGGDGCVQPQFWFDSNLDTIVAMRLQPDGRIVVVGTTDVDQFSQREWVVARLDADGGFDPCFGDPACLEGGLLIEPETDADMEAFEPNALALAPDGRIVIAGSANSATRDMAAVRLLPTGDVDTGFGNGGHRLVAFDLGAFNSDDVSALAVGANGSVLLAGTAGTTSGNLAAIALLDADGDLVPGFGMGGRTTVFFNDVAARSIVTAALLQADGKALISGYTRDLAVGGESGDCGIVRLLPNGNLDPVFGIDGKFAIDGALGLEDLRPDECNGLAANGMSIALFGWRQTGDALTSDSMVIVLDQDDLFRDGFEAD